MAWFFGNKQQKYIDNLEKNNKKHQEKEREEAEIITIGKATPEQQEERASQVVAQRNQKRMEAIEEEQEKEDKAQEDQLFVINGAKVKFGPHIGTFKVLSDTPTIQSKTVGTQIENAPLNFTFEDGFQLLTLTQWQDMGDAKFQGNVALIKKSTIVSTGKMSPANAPIESGKIEFIDSGQINVPENIDTTGMPLPLFNQTIEKSEYSLESNYFHNHLLEVAKEVISSIDEPDSYVYKFYKKIVEGQIKNPQIKVVKNLFSDKWGKYDTFSREIQISEKELIDIEEDNDRKIQLITILGECYAKYIEDNIQNLNSDTTNLEDFEYEFLKFDGFQNFDNICNISIAKLITPQNKEYSLNICLEPPKEILQEQIYKENYYTEQLPLESRRGYSNLPNSENLSSSPLPPPPDSDYGVKFGLSFKGGKPACFISFYVGMQKEIGRRGDYANMASFNATATLLYGTPGTNHRYNQVTGLFTLTPVYTLSLGEGRDMSLNTFNFLTGARVHHLPYAFAISSWITAVLSTAKTFPNYDEQQKDYGKSPYNTHDNNHSNQLIGGFGLKIADLSISSTNDIFKAPVFLGDGADQFYTANINLDLGIKDKILSYSNVMHYGKSDNLRPYNLDKDIKGQNYDFQSLNNLLYNNAMESVIIYSPNYGICHIGTRFGRMSMWASNLMHSTISFPKHPVMTMMKPLRDKYKSEKDFNNAMEKYENMKKQYDRDLKNYIESILLNDKAHFHYLYVPYNDKNEIDEKAVKEYIDAPQMRDKLPIKMK